MGDADARPARRYARRRSGGHGDCHDSPDVPLPGRTARAVESGRAARPRARCRACAQGRRARRRRPRIDGDVAFEWTPPAPATVPAGATVIYPAPADPAGDRDVVARQGERVTEAAAQLRVTDAAKGGDKASRACRSRRPASRGARASRTASGSTTRAIPITGGFRRRARGGCLSCTFRERIVAHLRRPEPRRLLSGWSRFDARRRTTLRRARSDEVRGGRRELRHVRSTGDPRSRRGAAPRRRPTIPRS
jgi:hypothetical protein